MKPSRDIHKHHTARQHRPSPTDRPHPIANPPTAPSPSHPQTTHTPLLALPPELRLRIYEYLHTPPYTCNLQQSTPYQTHQFRNQTPLLLVPLLRTCATLYHEVLPLLYSTTTFKLLISDTHIPAKADHTQFLAPRDSRNVWRLARRVQVGVYVPEVKWGEVAGAFRILREVAGQVPQEKGLEACGVRFYFLPDIARPELGRKMVEVGRRWCEREGLGEGEKGVAVAVWREAVRLAEAWGAMAEGLTAEEMETVEAVEAEGAEEEWWREVVH